MAVKAISEQSHTKSLTILWFYGFEDPLQQTPLKRQQVPTRLHGATNQNITVTLYVVELCQY